MQEVDILTGGRVKVGAGTLYNLLSRFEEEEIITQIVEENRKKVYLISNKGLALLRAEHLRLAQLVEDGNRLLEERSSPNEA